ncbi:Ig-like domain-containing protein [Desulfobacula sp.]|uniref:Ig-like domain-containing protein n=1 Tax=Desulfobacula sp. TaxID=2593537 RepID=UPI0026031F5F|nr:Ig-like domain-containing protein [Desulfobacula sp.]
MVINSQCFFTEGSDELWWPKELFEQFYNLNDDPDFDVAAYRNGRMKVAKTIAREIAPDYLIVLSEPDTEARQTGIEEIDTPEGATDLVRTILTGLADERAQGQAVGAGFGLWQVDYNLFLERFVELPLDFLDIHTYPVNNDFLTRFFNIADTAQAHGIKIASQEAWLYKSRGSELGHHSLYPPTFFWARDSYNFWEPLDSKFLELMADLARFKEFEYMASFWTGFFSSYIDYTDTTKGLSYAALLGQLTPLQGAAVMSGSYTGTALAYENAILFDGPDLQSPDTPSGVEAAPISFEDILISWEPVEDSIGTAGYEVYRDGTLIGTTTLTHFLDKQLPEAVPFAYTISAFDAPHNLSWPSSPIIAETPDATPPTAPLNLVATAISTSEIELKWNPSTDNTGITQYIIYRGQTESSLIPIAAVKEEYYLDTGLPREITVYYAVEATDKNFMLSGKSAVVSATTLSDQSPPTVPENVVAQSISDRQIDLSWNASTDVISVYGYIISGGSSPSDMGVLGFTSELLWSGIVPPETTKYFGIQAVDTSGNRSSMSQIVSATTDASEDIGSPAVSMFYPKEGDVIRKNAHLIAWAQDIRTDIWDKPSGIAQVRFEIDGAQVGSPDGDQPYYIIEDLSGFPKGTHTLTAVATDQAGHSTTSVPITVTID